MNPPIENGKAWGGLRIPLVIDGMVIISVVFICGQILTRLEFLERQQATEVSAERIAKVEGKIDRLDDKIDRAVSDLLKIDEASKRDRDSLRSREDDNRLRIERLEREGGIRR